MKRVHNTRQLMHLFCNMVDADLEGFKTPSRNIYFERGVLYSYGPHYPMAKKYRAFTGHQCRSIVLINSEKSSKTTEKHKTQLRQSTRPTQWTFGVPNILDPRDPENTSHLLDLIAMECADVLRGGIWSHVDQVTRQIAHYNQFARAFKLKEFQLDPEFYIDLAILSAKNPEKRELRKKVKAEKEAKKRAERAELTKSEVALWYTCQNTRGIFASDFGLPYDPVRVNGNRVESARGANVTLEQARSFCEVLKRGVNVQGQYLGMFKVEAQTAELVQIGCHTINIKQAIKAVLGE